MPHYDSDGDLRFYKHFNLQMAFTRSVDRVDSYAWVRVGEQGVETPERFLAWLSVHPSVGPVLDSTPREMDAYLDGG